MAGGGGTRLWPLSRQKLPKQFLAFAGNKTLLEMAYERARALTDIDHIFVATSAAYQEKTQALLPQVSPSHLFFEPERRDTTAAFATVALRLEALGQGDVPTIFMWCDHVFSREEVFIADLRRVEALVAANPEALVILAHTPLFPATTFGYCEVGERVGSQDNVYQVQRFTEKPDLATAEQFILNKKYFWNLGYFSLRPTYLLEQLRVHAPELGDVLTAYAAALAQGDSKAADAAYAKFPKLALEYTFVEKAKNIIAITGDYGWSDVGNWSTVSEVFGVNGDHMPQGHHVHVDSQDNYIYNTTDKVVSLLGVKNIVAVITDDAILITDKDSAAGVKDVVQRLEAEGKTEVL